MSLVMEEQSQPVFRDFLGPAPPAAPAPGPGAEAKQPEFSASDSVRVSQNSGFMEQEDGEASVRGGSTFSAAPGPSSAALGASMDPEAEIWRGSKPGAPLTRAPSCMSDENVRKREELGARGPYRENLNESGEGSRPAKISRFKQRDTEALPSTGDLCLAMQPPRPGQASNMWLQGSSVFKPDPGPGVSKRLENTRPSAGGGVPMMARPLQAGAGAPAPGMFSRNPASSSMQPPPADEGSRTGLQGGGIAALINSANAKQIPPTRPVGEASMLERTASLERPKPPPLQNGVSDSLLPSHKTSTTSATRQLTIFYGGHAHVFDDVSPDKAEAIMQLAGSNGRSWSTSYAHRSSRSEGSLIDLERRRDKPVNGSSSLGVGAEMQSSLQNMSYAGIPRKHHRMAPEHKLPADAPLPSGDGNRYGAANGRAANLHSSYYNSLKEASGNGQHWL